MSPPSPPDVSEVLALCSYEGVGRNLVSALKFRNARTVADWFALCFAHRLGADGIEADVITWLPASQRQRRRRGFDQAELLARPLSRRLDCQAVSSLRRIDHGRQTGRSRTARLDGPVVWPAGSRTDVHIRGRRVLLIDDVMTTGASLAAGAKTLRALGASDVVAAVVAYSP